ncbi:MULTISPECIES: restriction endonuclease [Planktothrix]|uniref:Restriction endonuclease family protein n=1 Tax=Planktothrix rubescens CCAP 1459/22 TaxID=329571 RepID=A0A6J7ZNC8_PLARU|nr:MULTISPECIES: restriction endonuclease [Planktothrix]CAC5344030.1 Restriction endonuclease family protein [Planktothrix rubescens NIVA-CYA 18]CAD5910886.1 Mrr restriction system protein-like protein [Planktothrix rubescens NIVA-CYA 18]
MNQSPIIPSLSDLIEPLIKALKTLGGSGTVQEIYDKVCELGNFSDVQQNILHKQGPNTEIAYRLAWARTNLRIYGALENVRRGVWSLTEKGRNLEAIDITEINKVVQKSTQQKSQLISGNKNDQEIKITPSNIDFTNNTSEHEFIKINDQIPIDSDIWTEKLLKILQQIPPDSFERLCQRILRESGFIKVEVTGRKGDGGIDGIGVLKIALLSFQVFFQCKRYTGSVGPSEIRDFRGAMVGRTDKGLFLTTGTFTSSAKQEATRDGAPVLDLIDGEQLCQILKDLNLGVETKMIEVVEIDQNWFNHL